MWRESRSKPGLILDAVNPPVDRYNFSYLTFLALGVAILLPWNSLIMALDYFTVKLPNHDVDFLVSILSNGPLFIMNAILLIFHRFFPAPKTIAVCLVLMVFLNILLPIFPTYVTDEGLDWVLFFMVIMILSCVNGILQSCCFSLVGSFPGRCIASLNTGCALSGLIISVARAFTLLLFPTSEDKGNRSNFLGYFVIGSLGLVVCISMFGVMVRTSYYTYYRQRPVIVNYVKQQYQALKENGELSDNLNDTSQIID